MYIYIYIYIKLCATTLLIWMATNTNQQGNMLFSPDVINRLVDNSTVVTQYLYLQAARLQWRVGGETLYCSLLLFVNFCFIIVLSNPDKMRCPCALKTSKTYFFSVEHIFILASSRPVTSKKLHYPHTVQVGNSDSICCMCDLKIKNSSENT